MDTKGSTETSITHRVGIAEGQFYKKQRALTRKGNVEHKLDTWSKSIVATAMHGCSTWHMTRELLHQVRTSELRGVRKILRLKPIQRLGEEYAGGMAYNQRTTNVAYDRCIQHGI